MIRTTYFLAVLSVLLFSSLSATEDKFVQGRYKTLSLAPAIVVNAMAFSPDGKLLAVSGERPEDNYECIPLPVQVWDVTTGERLKVVEGSASLEHSLGFSLDGTLLARALYSYVRDPAIVLYDTETWTVERTLNSVKRERQGIIEKFRINFRWDPVRFLPNGNLLVRFLYDRDNGSSVLGAINLEGELQREYNLSPSFFSHISPDFRRILFIERREIQKEFSKSTINEFFVYDLATMEQTHTLQIESDYWGGVFFFDEEMISFRLKDQYLWNLDSGTLRKGDFPFASFDWVASVHPSGKEFAATRSRDGIEIRDRATFAVRDSLSIEGIARQALFSPTGDVLAISTGIQPFHCGLPDAPAATIELWNVRSEDEEDVANSDNEDTPAGEGTPEAEETATSGDVQHGMSPHTLTKVSGDEQEGLAGVALAAPFVVSVLDEEDEAVAGVVVTFSVTAGGGILSATTATTDANGQATTTLTLILGSDTETNTVSATVEGLESEIFTATAVGQAIPDSLAKISGDGQEGTVGDALAEPFIVSVADEDGAAIAGVVVTFSVTAGGGILSDTTATTDANGQAVTRLTLGSDAGTNTVSATVEGLESVTFTATGKESPLASLFDAFLGGGKRVALPDRTLLLQNAPNPFNSETILTYFLNTPGPTHLEVFALTGQKVAVLHQEPQQAGYHRLRWNGRDDAGRPVASGMYLYRLVTADGVLTRKLILLR